MPRHHNHQSADYASGQVPQRSLKLSPKNRIAAIVNAMLISGAFALITLVHTGAVYAAESTNYNVPAGNLEDALNSFAKQSGITLTFDPAVVKGKTVPAINGQLSQQQALEKLLKGTGLEPVTKDGAMVIKPIPLSHKVDTLPEVSVTNQKETNGLAKPYAGGQIAKGGGLGILGNKNFMDTPFNQSNYTAQTIEDTQARSLSDLLIADPSVRLSSARTNINEDFSVRGFPIASQDVAINGMYGLSPYFRTPIEFAERVEVLKGPSALLNGMPPSGNIGGSINLIPKRAGAEPLTRVTGSYVSDSIFGGHVDVGRRFGENKEFGMRFNGAYRDGNTSLDLQKQEETLGALALDYKGERFRVSADLMYQQQNIDRVTRQFSTAAGLTNIPHAPDGKTNYPGYGYSKMKDRTQVIRGEYDILDNLTVYGGYGVRTSRMDALAGNPTILDTTGNFSSGPAWQLFNVDSRSLEAGVKAKFLTGEVGHAVSFGATKVTQNQSIFFATGLGPTKLSNLYDPIYSETPSTSGITSNITKFQATQLTSYALADTISFLQDRIQVTLGARHQTVESPNYQFGTGAKVGPSYDESAVTPVAGLVVKPWDNVSFYANYIEGLSPGASPPIGIVGKTLSPFKTKQKEVGVKVDWGRIATTASLFEIERPSAFTENGVFGVNGEQRNRGIELNVFGEVIDHVRLLGGLAYTQGKLTKTQGGTFDGNYAVSVPKIQANIGAEWDTLALPGLTLIARTIYTSKQYNDQANDLSIPSWTRFDIGARYRTILHDKPVVFRANVENLFDKDYWGSSNAGFLFIGAPRTLLMSATVDF